MQRRQSEGVLVEKTPFYAKASFSRRDALPRVPNSHLAREQQTEHRVFEAPQITQIGPDDRDECTRISVVYRPCRG